MFMTAVTITTQFPYPLEFWKGGGDHEDRRGNSKMKMMIESDSCCQCSPYSIIMALSLCATQAEALSPWELIRSCTKLGGIDKAMCTHIHMKA